MEDWEKEAFNKIKEKYNLEETLIIDSNSYPKHKIFVFSNAKDSIVYGVKGYGTKDEEFFAEKDYKINIDYWPSKIRYKNGKLFMGHIDIDKLVDEDIKEEEEKIKKEIIYEDKEKELPRGIKIVERKIISPRDFSIDKFCYNCPGGITADIRYNLALRYLTNNRFPSHYTMTHAFNGYGSSGIELERHFDEIINTKIKFPLWVLFADWFMEKDCFVFGKQNPNFKKALERNIEHLNSIDVTREKLLSDPRKYEKNGEWITHEEMWENGWGRNTRTGLLSSKIEKINMVYDLGEEDPDCEEPYEIRGSIAALMYYDIPLWTGQPFGRRITIVGDDVKFKDAEMYIDLKGKIRDKNKVLSDGPKIIFFK
ncbi:MAG: hypothetical protein QXW65_01655 [Candidatus Pacearchaeota archaeon]